MRRAALATLVALAALGAARAEAGDYDVARALGAELVRVAARTEVPVRVPTRLVLDFGGRVYASGSAGPGAWSLTLAGAPRCGGDACFLASFRGERGGRLAFRRTVRLARGLVGAYKPLTCGASCSPPLVQWVQGGVLYEIQAKLGVAGARAQRAALVRAANEAIAARPA